MKRKRLILVHDDDDSVPTDPSDDETQLTLCSMKRAIYRHARWCPFIRINKRILNLHRRLEANIVTHDDEDSDDPQQPKPAAKKQRLNTEQRPTVTEIDKQDKQDNRDKDQQPLASNQPSVARGAQAEIASRRRPQQRKASKRPEAKIKPSQSKAKASSTKNAEDVEGNDVTIADTENRSFEDNGSTINLATAKRAVGKEDGEENETTPGDVANTPIAKGRSITLKKGNVSKAPSFEPRSAKPDDDLTDTEESDKPAKEGSEVGSAPPPRRPRAASTQKRGRKGKK